jgi:hypothetical protein
LLIFCVICGINLNRLDLPQPLASIIIARYIV